MMGLWADGWFYISSAGLLISGGLFFILLGQYRVASEAADVTDGEHVAEKELPASEAIRPVYVPDEPSSVSIASHADKIEAKQEPKPEFKPKADAAEYSGIDRRKDAASTTGGISPAVVYLQNIKGELAELHQELRAVSKRVDDQLAAASQRDEALIERLGELVRAVESAKRPAAATEEPVPAPKKTRKIEKAPEPEPVIEVVVPPPAVAPQEPAVTAPSDQTIRVDLGAAFAPSIEKSEVSAPAEQAPAEAQAEQVQIPSDAPPEEKPRRGPVWPV